MEKRGGGRTSKRGEDTEVKETHQRMLGECFFGGRGTKSKDKKGNYLG